MRYLIAILGVVAFVALVNLAVGRSAAWPDFIPAVISVCATAYFSRSKRRAATAEAPIGPVYAALGLALTSAILAAEIYRIRVFLMSGRLLIFSDWYVSWSERPIGLIVAIAVHLLLILTIAVMAAACGVELRSYFRARR